MTAPYERLSPERADATTTLAGMHGRPPRLEELAAQAGVDPWWLRDYVRL
jgi:hypothetical protein